MTEALTERPAPPRKGVPHTVTVTAVRRLTPHLVRVTVAGDELATVDPTPYTDRYVKLVLGEAAEPGGRPLVRTYTIRSLRDGEWDLDLVVHGDEGVGGPWATRVRPGEPVTFLGPGGGYAPDPAAPWHLLVGDDSALPAIAASLEALPPGAVARAFVEIPGPDDEQVVTTAADARITWVHRGAATLEDVVVAAHAAGELPDGAPHAFLHGEAGSVRVLRRWARADLGVPRERLSASGYWRRGRTDESWRAEKREWVAAVEQDDAALGAD
jgi:NADPH-dependent ferric siderophore reductase